MTFDQFLKKVQKCKQFVSCNLTAEPDPEAPDEGVYEAVEAGQLILSVCLQSGKTTVSLTFEGNDMDDIIEQAMDHVNLVLATTI